MPALMRIRPSATSNSLLVYGRSSGVGDSSRRRRSTRASKGEGRATPQKNKVVAADDMLQLFIRALAFAAPDGLVAASHYCQLVSTALLPGELLQLRFVSNGLSLGATTVLAGARGAGPPRGGGPPRRPGAAGPRVGNGAGRWMACRKVLMKMRSTHSLIWPPGSYCLGIMR